MAIPSPPPTPSRPRKDEWVNCPKCDGVGALPVPMGFFKACPACFGTGLKDGGLR